MSFNRNRIFLTSLAFFLFFASIFSFAPKAGATAGDNIYGWGWGANRISAPADDGIGWISFNNCTDPGDSRTCSRLNNYGLKYDATTGYITGYAWSSNVGWIQFGCPVGATCLSGFPSLPGSGTIADNAKIDVDSASHTYGKVTGWARALSLPNPNDTELPSEWADGWISLSGGGKISATYGVSFNMTDGTGTGYAWGSNVLGWISFANVKIKKPVLTATLTIRKIVINDDGGKAKSRNFMIHVKNSTGEAPGSPQEGSATGTAYTLDAGKYTVGEDLLAGYTMTGITDDCAADGSITLAPGDTKTCTITNDDNPASQTTIIKLRADEVGSSGNSKVATASTPNPLSDTQNMTITSGHSVQLYWAAQSVRPGEVVPSFDCSLRKSTASNPLWGFGSATYSTSINPPVWGGDVTTLDGPSSDTTYTLSCYSSDIVNYPNPLTAKISVNVISSGATSFYPDNYVLACGLPGKTVTDTIHWDFSKVSDGPCSTSTTPVFNGLPDWAMPVLKAVLGSQIVNFPANNTTSAQTYALSISCPKKGTIGVVSKSGTSGGGTTSLSGGSTTGSTTTGTSTPSSNVGSTIYVTVNSCPRGVILSINSCVKAAGDTTLLSWSSVGMVSCGIDNGIGEVSLSGSKSVTINADTTFNITCTGEDGLTYPGSASVKILGDSCVVPKVIPGFKEI